MADSMLDQILKIKEELDAHNAPEPFRELHLSHEEYMKLHRELPGLTLDRKEKTGAIPKEVLGLPIKIRNPMADPPEPPKPDQEEMDKLASALTEAVLQLRAGDMDGARKTLMDADYQCGMRIHTQIPSMDHYLDALRYGMGVKMSHQPGVCKPPPRVTATEILMQQQIADRRMREIMEEMNKNIISPVITNNISE